MLSRKQRKLYRQFRTGIKKLGFRQLQKSVYIKVVPSAGSTASISRAIDAVAPNGYIHLLPISAECFSHMITIRGQAISMDELLNDYMEI